MPPPPGCCPLIGLAPADEVNPRIQLAPLPGADPMLHLPEGQPTVQHLFQGEHPVAGIRELIDQHKQEAHRIGGHPKSPCAHPVDSPTDVDRAVTETR